MPPATLLQALNRVDLEGIKDLLAKGADVNAKDDDGGTPLLIAVTLGNKEIAELLIANGADVNVKDKHGGTPLDWADGEIAALLRKHGGKTGDELN